MDALTTSRLRTFRTCKRLHHFRYELCRRPVGAPALPLAFGTFMHFGLEAWWLSFQHHAPSESLDRALAAMDKVVEESDDEGELDEYERARARELMRGYHFRWYAEQTEFEVVGVEAQFVGPLINPATNRPSKIFQLAGKIDAICRRPGEDRVKIVEHKTTSKDIGPTSTYWPRLRLDGQVSTYFVGGQMLGHEVDGCIYDVLRKPAIRPLKATAMAARKYTKAGVLHANQREEDESVEAFALRVREAIIPDPEGWYQRADITRVPDVLREHGIDRWADARALRECQLASSWPTNPDACEDRYGRLCGYWSVCTGTASIDDDELFRISPKHSELDLPEVE